MTDTLPIKGQECLFTMSGPDGLEESVDHVKDASFTFNMDILEEQYLGHTANQYDDIYRGVTVEITFDLASPKVFDLVHKAIERARRRTSADTKFSVVSALKFPNGERRRMLFPDLKFGEIPTNFGGRDEYGEVTFTLQGSSYRKL